MAYESLDMDAFSDGQIQSKLWLCNELERVAEKRMDLLPAHVWILGGWYGILGLLLRSRQRLRISGIRSFDICETATRIANRVNNAWEIKDWEFRAFQQDANELKYSSGEFGPPPKIVINTACEHFEQLAWWDLIPSGTLVALQSNDMSHDDHCSTVQSLDEMEKTYCDGFAELSFKGELKFMYPQWTFRRFMLIGVKA